MTERNIQFEWSAKKAASNLKKHGISFEEAETAFDDEHAYIQEDELHSDDEQREWLIGYSNRNRLLIVAFVRRAYNLIRLITARLTTRRERKIYEERSRI